MLKQPNLKGVYRKRRMHASQSPWAELAKDLVQRY
jgi:hypothetical protein